MIIIDNPGGDWHPASRGNPLYVHVPLYQLSLGKMDETYHEGMREIIGDQEQIERNCA